MFGGPPEHDLNFDRNGILSTASFLNRVQKLGDRLQALQTRATYDELLTGINESKPQDTSFLIEVLKLLVDYEKKISKDRFFHVAFARLMELTNKI